MTLLDRCKKELTITVTFVNQIDQSIIGRSEVSVEQLPETFAINTVIHLGEEEWQILKADPCDKADFIKTQELTLMLLRIESINPADISFSLPTIASDLLAFSETTFSVNFTHTLREDDWRQCEFFDIHQKDRIMVELKKVEKLIDNHQKRTQSETRTYDKIHVRDLTNVAELSFSLMAFLSKLQVSDVGAVRFEGDEQYIAQGFAVETASNMYYGILGVNYEGTLGLEDLVVKVLGVQPKSEDREEITQLLQTFDLLYVDWCEAQTIDRLN